MAADYQSRFFKNLKKVYDDIDNSFPDVTLHCIEDDVHLKAHRVILATSSDYFKNVFTWSTEDVIKVHNGITGETLIIILKYIYSGRITITLNNVTDVLSAANYFALMEIVEDCIKFILDNIEISTCLDMFKFSWQLDLSKLIKGIESFIGHNFPYILTDKELNTKLHSFPSDLMAVLLKSNDLVLRDEETNLLTRPVEREKLLLEFILTYTEKLTDRSKALSSLLTCIKWPLFKIFNEEEFLYTSLLPRLDSTESRKDEIKKLIDITYTDWFLSPENCVPTEEDESIFSTRAFSCSELIPLHPMADGNEESGLANYFSIIAKEYERITKIDIVTRLWDGRTVIGGIGIYFSSKNGSNHEHIGVVKEIGTEISTIELEEKAHIISAHGYSGWLIDNIVFETSEKKTLGPYGGTGGALRNNMATIEEYRKEGGYREIRTFANHKSIAPGPHKRVPLDSILVGITGKEVTTQNDLAITHLKFIFREMLPSSKFMINSAKKCEVSLPDPNCRTSSESYFNRPSSPGSYSDEYEDHHHGYTSSDDEYHDEDYNDDDLYHSEYDDEIYQF